MKLLLKITPTVWACKSTKIHTKTINSTASIATSNNLFGYGQMAGEQTDLGIYKAKSQKTKAITEGRNVRE